MRRTINLIVVSGSRFRIQKAKGELKDFSNPHRWVRAFSALVMLTATLLGSKHLTLIPAIIHLHIEIQELISMRYDWIGKAGDLAVRQHGWAIAPNWLSADSWKISPVMRDKFLLHLSALSLLIAPRQDLKIKKSNHKYTRNNWNDKSCALANWR